MSLNETLIEINMQTHSLLVQSDFHLGFKRFCITPGLKTQDELFLESKSKEIC